MEIAGRLGQRHEQHRRKARSQATAAAGAIRADGPRRLDSGSISRPRLAAASLAMKSPSPVTTASLIDGHRASVRPRAAATVLTWALASALAIRSIA